MKENKSLWEIAELSISGSLTKEQEQILNENLKDPSFTNEFNENVSFLKSLKIQAHQNKFKASLKDIQKDILVNSKPKHFAKILDLPVTFWRTASVAACVALLTSTITYWSLTPSIKKNDNRYTTISKEVEHIKKGLKNNTDAIASIQKNTSFVPAPPPSDVRYTGTGYALTNDGYFVTAYHVINNGKFDSVYIQNNEGLYFKASLVRHDDKADIAIMKVEKKNFKFSKSDIPYTFSTSKESIGSHIFALGYPNDEEVYSEGYISSKNGFDGNDLQYTLQLPANHGQSGSPVMDGNGVIIGMLTAIGGQGETNTYAVSTKALMNLLQEMTDIKTFHLPKNNKIKKLSRENQIIKLETFTFSVKVYKK